MRKTILDAIWPPPLGLRPLGQPPQPQPLPSHFGHAYERLAIPPNPDGKVDVDKRDTWLEACAKIAVSSDYPRFYERWKSSFKPGSSRTEEITAKSRLLVGHGNPSGADVGLTVHHTWGVPILPGSAQKGLLAHYIDAVYGDDGPLDDERRKWRAPTWKERRVASEDRAGEYFATLFGAPAVTGDEKAARGGVVEFHDALYVPGSALRNQPFVRDVLTVHQKTYYDSSGENDWPNDWDDPNPVGFITVLPDVRFLLALTGSDDDWTNLAMRLLREALAAWGAGGKTSAGYGRMG